MNPENNHSTPVKGSSLAAMLPPGILELDESAPDSQAFAAFEALQEVIRAASVHNAAMLRLALFQTFPRILARKTGQNVELPQDYLRRYFLSIAPAWFADVVRLLDESECEVLLKNYLTAHESWGTLHGLGVLVRTLLEACVHTAIQVRTAPLAGEERAIPEELQTQLGRRYTTLGRDFSAGRRYRCRPQRTAIFVGPISHKMLSTFQEKAWAKNVREGTKMMHVLSLAEPYYLRAEVHYLVTMTGFVVAKARLGKEKLGNVYA